jgi:hypothetical protein
VRNAVTRDAHYGVKLSEFVGRHLMHVVVSMVSSLCDDLDASDLEGSE